MIGNIIQSWRYNRSKDHAHSRLRSFPGIGSVLLLTLTMICGCSDGNTSTANSVDTTADSETGDTATMPLDTDSGDTDGLDTETVLFDTSGSANTGVGCDCGDAFDYCTGNSIQIHIERGYTNSYAYTFNSADGDVACGRFANGDYWLAPLPGQSDVIVREIVVGGGTGGADVDPSVEAQGFLNSPYGNYVPERNLLADGGLPVSIAGRHSLVTGIQKDESANGACETKAIVGSCIDTYNVVTVLDAPLLDSGNYLRPAVNDPAKSLTAIEQFDFTRFPSSDLFEGTDADGLAAIAESWRHHLEIFSVGDRVDGAVYSEGGRAFRADLVTEEYAGHMAQTFHGHLAKLFSNGHTMAEKQLPLASMLSFGQDLFYALYECDASGCTYTRKCMSGAGQHMGKLPPMALFAALHTNTLYGATLQAMAEVQQGTDACQEIEQVNIGINGQGIWGDGPDAPSDDIQNTLIRYWSAVVAGKCFNGADGYECNPSQGKKTGRDYYGYIDGPAIKPGSAYFGVTSGGIRSLAIEMMLIPEMRAIVNHDPIIEYAARIKSATEGMGVRVSPDACAPPDPRDFCKAEDVTDATKTACFGIPVEQLHPDCGIWSDREYCGHFGFGPNTEASVTVVTWGTEPNVADLSDVTGRCVKNGTTWTRTGDGWVSASAQPGEINYGQTGRFSADEYSNDYEIGNPVWAFESAFDTVLEAFRADTTP